MIDDVTTLSLHTPAGPVTVDIKEGLDAYNAALHRTNRQPSAECRRHEEYLCGKKISNVTRCWRYRSGELVLSELDSYIDEEWDVHKLTRFTNHGMVTHGNRTKRPVIYQPCVINRLICVPNTFSSLNGFLCCTL